ncbi:hypothetical protein NPIL_330901 [Nephila pilipes]|uniref:Uncharacterized protein n=1 Tax=Nephila pilipes TaxID=299642 RepID=A0A8X6PYQ1_NEPPI|nr:hypothetical protein NPIL_330901 [Nephila pilipes]
MGNNAASDNNGIALTRPRHSTIRIQGAMVRRKSRANRDLIQLIKHSGITTRNSLEGMSGTSGRGRVIEPALLVHRPP